MNTPTPLIRDVLPLLRDQLSAEAVHALFLLAIEDPILFALEVLASAKAGRVELPGAVLASLEAEVTETEAPPQATPPTTPPARVDVDPLVRRQRRVDAVARQVRERLDRGDRAESVPNPRAARPAAVLNKAGLDPG